MITLSQGILIVFEGIDGTGKSTQIRLLKDFLLKRGYQVTPTREPTDSQFGKRIRALYENRGSISRDEELELFLADRREHVATLIEPTLKAGGIVLCDRYYLSTAAYQGAAGFDPARIIKQNSFAPTPDRAYLLEIDVNESIRRITISRGDRLNDFEQLESLKKVDKIFRSLQFPYIKRIDGSLSIEQISSIVREDVLDLLEKTDVDV